MRNLITLALALFAVQASAVTIEYPRTVFPAGRAPNAIMAPKASDTDTYNEVLSTGNALHSYQAYLQAGERNEGSTTGTDYMAMSEETKCDTVDTSVDSTTVYNGPAILSYIYVNTGLSAHTVVISDNATAKFTLPASLAAGSERSPRGAQFRTSLVVDPDNASTGNITVCYRPLDAEVNW
jgi:hypothetical protein